MGCAASRPVVPASRDGQTPSKPQDAFAEDADQAVATNNLVEAFGSASRSASLLASSTASGRPPPQPEDRISSHTSSASLGGWRGQIAGVFAKHDSGAWNEFVDSRLGAKMIGSSMLIGASKTAVVPLLNQACNADDPVRIKGALLAAQRLGVTEVPEFERAAERYRGLRVLPEHWDASRMTRDRQGRRLITKTCVTDSDALAYFQTLLDETFRKVQTRDRRDGDAPDRLELAEVIDVANEDLWIEYVARRQAILAELETDAEDMFEVTPTTSEVLFLPERPGLNLLGPPLEIRANEALLFHGTRGVAADRIATTDFELSRCGSNAGTLYGRGIYFAENSSKSDEYSPPDGTGDLRTLLLCRVTLGRPFYTNELKPDGRQCQAKCQSGPFHSVLGDRRACSRTFREFVIFDEEQAYPNYIIRYRRRHGTVLEAT